MQKKKKKTNFSAIVGYVSNIKVIKDEVIERG